MAQLDSILELLDLGEEDASISTGCDQITVIRRHLDLSDSSLMHRHLDVLHGLRVEVVEWVRIDPNRALRGAKEYRSIFYGYAYTRKLSRRRIMLQCQVLALLCVDSHLMIRARTNNQVIMTIIRDCIVFVSLLRVINMTQTSLQVPDVQHTQLTYRDKVLVL